LTLHLSATENGVGSFSEEFLNKVFVWGLLLAQHFHRAENCGFRIIFYFKDQFKQKLLPRGN
jgi:hypothetical protein